MRTLLDIWNEDTYDETAARRLISGLYEHFKRTSASFDIASLSEFEAIGLGNLTIRGFGRLVSLVDAFHPKGEWRLILYREGELAARRALEAYLGGVDIAPTPESPLYASHRLATGAIIDNLSEQTRTYCMSAQKRIKDFYALSDLCSGPERPVVDLVVAIILEASHRVDDYYDNKPKWFDYSHADPGQAIAEALQVIAELLAGKPYREQILQQSESCLAYVDSWVGGDSRASGLYIDDNNKRIFECNADLYRRFYELCHVATDIDESMESVFEAFGALIWVLDDWRDVEADALNDHFNVFTSVRMDVSEQAELLKTYFHRLLKGPRTLLQPEQLEEFMISAGTTPTMQRCLEL